MTDTDKDTDRWLKELESKEREIKRKEELFKQKLPAYIFILGIILLLIPPLFPERISTQSYSNAVLVRPDSGNTKLYELDASITSRSTYGFAFLMNRTVFEIESVTWPNGGTVTVSDCQQDPIESIEDRIDCSIGDERYQIRLSRTPTRPTPQHK